MLRPTSCSSGAASRSRTRAACCRATWTPSRSARTRSRTWTSSRTRQACPSSMRYGRPSSLSGARRPAHDSGALRRPRGPAPCLPRGRQQRRPLMEAGALAGMEVVVSTPYGYGPHAEIQVATHATLEADPLRPCAARRSFTRTFGCPWARTPSEGTAGRAGAVPGLHRDHGRRAGTRSSCTACRRTEVRRSRRR